MDCFDIVQVPFHPSTLPAKSAGLENETARISNYDRLNPHQPRSVLQRSGQRYIATFVGRPRIDGWNLIGPQSEKENENRVHGISFHRLH